MNFPVKDPNQQTHLTIDAEKAVIEWVPEQLVDDFIEEYNVYASENGQMDQDYEASHERITYDEIRLTFVAKFLRKKGMQHLDPEVFFKEYERAVSKRIAAKKNLSIVEILWVSENPHQTKLPCGPDDHFEALQKAREILRPGVIDHLEYEITAIVEELERAHTELHDDESLHQVPDHAESIVVHARRLYGLLLSNGVSEPRVRELGELLTQHNQSSN